MSTPKEKREHSVEIQWQGHSIRGTMIGYGWEDITREVLEDIQVYVEDADDLGEEEES